MNKPKFTQGPLTCSEATSFPKGWHVLSPKGGWLATVGKKENAQLFTQAPRMYEALKALLAKEPELTTGWAWLEMRQAEQILSDIEKE